MNKLMSARSAQARVFLPQQSSWKPLCSLFPSRLGWQCRTRGAWPRKTPSVMPVSFPVEPNVRRVCLATISGPSSGSSCCSPSGCSRGSSPSSSSAASSSSPSSGAYVSSKCRPSVCGALASASPLPLHPLEQRAANLGVGDLPAPNDLLHPQQSQQIDTQRCC